MTRVVGTEHNKKRNTQAHLTLTATAKFEHFGYRYIRNWFLHRKEGK